MWPDIASSLLFRCSNSYVESFVSVFNEEELVFGVVVLLVHFESSRDGYVLALVG